MLIETIALAQVLVAVEVESPAGELYVQLCDEADYMQAQCAHQAVKPAAPVVTFIFEDVAPGEWAVMAWRDTDSDGEMATGLFGIPTEPVAIYGDPRGFFGPPSFSASAVTISAQGGRLEMQID